MRGLAERVTWQSSLGPRVPAPVWLACGSVPPVDVAVHHGPLQHEISGDKPRTPPEQHGQCTLASADIHNQLSRPHVGVSDDAPGPLVNERVPAPRSS